MTNNLFVSKFCIKETSYYVKIDWKQDENDLFHIVIFDQENNTWSGHFSHKFAEKFSEIFEESKEEYRKNVRAGLTNNSGMYEYDFKIKSDNDGEFCWKKKYEGSVLRLHGKVPVHKNECLDSKDSLIDILIQENKHLKQHIDECELNVQMLCSELENTKSELEKFIDVKSSLETSVYGKFIQLMNSKKRRIQLLEQNLQHLHSQGNTLSDNELD